MHPLTKHVFGKPKNLQQPIIFAHEYTSWNESLANPIHLQFSLTSCQKTGMPHLNWQYCGMVAA